LRIRPTSDIDKLLDYWRLPTEGSSPELRSLFEAVKRLEDGGSVSLLYLLPPFAREQLYNYPLPPPAEPAMDCHWSTLKFINATFDGRSVEAKDIGRYVATNCFQVGQPTRYGDMIFLLDKNGRPVHSAVYIAADIVFTKEGGDFRQPWTLTRMKDMATKYSAIGAAHVAVWRKKPLH
jgi:hypothetical protein